MKSNEVENILTLKSGRINDGVLRAIILDNTNELRKVCKSYSPERLCEKMTKRTDEALINKVFAVNLLMSKEGESQAIYKCSLNRFVNREWQWKNDHYYAPVNSSDLFHIENGLLTEMKLPNVVRRNENHKFFVVTTDERAKSWSRDDIEKNITISQEEDYYSIGQSTTGQRILQELGKSLENGKKSTVIKVVAGLFALYVGLVIAYKLGTCLVSIILAPFRSGIKFSKGSKGERRKIVMLD